MLHCKKVTRSAICNEAYAISCVTHLGLLEEDGPLRVDAAGQQAGRHVQDAGSEQSRVLRHRDGVQVHDAVQHGGEALLQGHPVLQGAQVVSQVWHPGWLDS